MNTRPGLVSVYYSLSAAVESVVVTCSCIECGRTAEGRSIDLGIDYLWKEQIVIIPFLAKGACQLLLRCGVGVARWQI